MLESFVVTLREGVEAALVIAVVLAYLEKIDRVDLVRAVWIGLGAALAGSIAGAAFLQRLDINEDVFEGWIMLAAAASVTTMVVWMSRTSHRLRGHIETRVGTYAGRGRGAAWGVGIFVFLMVAREGVETVLLVTAVSFTTSAIANVIGAFLGLCGAVLVGVLFVRGAFRVHMGRFFQVTTVILLVVAAQLLLTGLHELSEALVLPSSRREMELIGPLVTNSALFFIVVIALAAFLLVRTGAGRPPAVAETSDAARRLALAAERRDRRRRSVATFTAGVAAVSVAAHYVYERNANALVPPAPLTASAAGVRIPAADLADGKLHRYVVDVAGTPVRLIAIRSGDDVRTAFDACQICGAAGYLQKGPNVVCTTCGSAINIPTIGEGGGCNPRHVDSRVEGNGRGDVVVPLAALQAGSAYFR